MLEEDEDPRSTITTNRTTRRGPRRARPDQTVPSRRLETRTLTRRTPCPAFASRDRVGGAAAQNAKSANCGGQRENMKRTSRRSRDATGMTRMGLRRGRSFTSLLNNGQGGQASPSNAASPKLERSLRELYQPPNSTIPETHDESDSKPPSPVLRPVEPFSARGSISSTAPLLYPPTPMTDNSLGSEAFLAADAATTKSLRDFVPQLVILVALFVSSFAVIFAFISTLPGLFLPHSVADLPQLTATLSAYRASSFLAELHLFGVLTVLFLWKQCFSIPGSVLTNILFGALYGTTMGTWWACLWTATGSTGAYLIALVIAPLVSLPSRDLLTAREHV